MKRIIAMSIMVCLLSISSVYGEIYSYVDEEGRHWFVDKISAIPERYRQNSGKIKAPKTGVSLHKDQQMEEKKRSRS